MTNFNYKQARNQAGTYGFVIGSLWIASFGCYMAGLTTPFLSHLCIILGLFSPFVAAMLIRKYKHSVAILNFWKTWWMALLIFMYATLLTAAGQYVYFRFIDNGRMLNAYTTLFESPEYQELLQQATPNGEGKEILSQALELMGSMTPIELTFELMFSNLILGFFLSIITALLAQIPNRK